MSKTDKKSTSQSAVKETPKVMNEEAARIVALTHESLGRFIGMMDGLDHFCSNVDKDGAERDFACAVAYLSQLIKSDAENIREKLGEIRIRIE